MAGTNHIIKPGQVLFHAGDKSDGMYIIRRGELKVFLPREGSEIELAKLTEGGMVGEMALFDQKPRSASVKAIKESEVTHITSTDFEKLMRQIPKWFVTLMTSLSTRLRQTNDRLQLLEAEVRSSEGTQGRMKSLKRILYILAHMIQKDAVKDGKDWSISRASLEEALIHQFEEPSDRVKITLEVLVKEQILTLPKNGQLGIPNRAAVLQLAQSLHHYLATFPGIPCLSEAQRAIMSTLEKVGSQSPYDSLTISLRDLDKEARKLGLKPNGWEEAAQVFSKTGEDIKLVKTSGGDGLRVRKKELSALIRFHSILAAFHQANLS